MLANPWHRVGEQQSITVFCGTCRQVRMGGTPLSSQTTALVCPELRLRLRPQPAAETFGQTSAASARPLLLLPPMW